MKKFIIITVLLLSSTWLQVDVFAQITLTDEIKNALLDEKYPLAISLLNKLYKDGNNEKKAFALEFLGVARERNFQLAFAKQYYQRFLNEYPEHKSTVRVKQRLSSLIGIEEYNKNKKLRDGKKASRSNKNNTRGSVSADYRKSDLTNDIGQSRETLSLISTNIDLRGDYQLDSGNLQFRFSGGRYEDLLDGRSTSNRLRYANVSWSNNDDLEIDIGRQRSSGKGLFNRFDGIVFGYSKDKNQKFNLVVGAPVASSKNTSIDTERTFYGFSFEFNDYFENVDLSFFGLRQTIGSLTDRQAVGGEFKYFGDGILLYSLVDYDIFHSELNAFLVSSSYTSENKTRYHLSFNQRKSPYISTRNALIGQAADSLEELQTLFITDEEILDLAADRTLESKTATLSLSTPVSANFDLSGSVTWLALSGAPASGGVAEIIQPGNQLYFNTSLRGRNLYSSKDSSQVGIRISQLNSSDVSSYYISSRYRFTKNWSLSAKLRFDDRENHSGGGQQNFAPSFRLQYQNQQHYVYTDLGAILYTNQRDGRDDVSTDIYYLYLGYRWYF